MIYRTAGTGHAQIPTQRHGLGRIITYRFDRVPNSGIAVRVGGGDINRAVVKQSRQMSFDHVVFKAR